MSLKFLTIKIDSISSFVEQIVYSLLDQGTPFNEKGLFNLHKAVQTHVIIDIYKPVEGWKKEPNSTVGVIDEKQVLFEYAAPNTIMPWDRLKRENSCCRNRRH